MYVLAIDTSNQVMGIALLDDENVIGEVTTNLKRNHSVSLMPAIERLMQETGVTPEMLGKIVVAKGPGSFTGLRIGMTTAKTLAWTLNIPIVSVSSLAVLAYQGYLTDQLVCPFFDARRGNVYTGLYLWQDGTSQLIKSEQNIAMAEWLDLLAKEEQPVLFISPNIAQYQAEIKRKLGHLAIIPPAPFHLAKPAHLAFMGRNEPSESVHNLTPNYLRLAEAEAKWLNQQKGRDTND